MGISLLEILLAKESAIIRIMAPIIPLKIPVLKSFFFLIIRPIWGAIRPMKVIRPVTETILATTKVAPIIAKVRITVTFTPRLLPSSSDKDSMLICHLSKNKIIIPRMKNGRIDNSLSKVMPAKLPMDQNSMAASCLSGSAKYFNIIIIPWLSEVVTMPARTILEIPLSLDKFVRPMAANTANRPPKKAAKPIIKEPPDRNMMAMAAPRLAQRKLPLYRE